MSTCVPAGYIGQERGDIACLGGSWWCIIGEEYVCVM